MGKIRQQISNLEIYNGIVNIFFDVYTNAIYNNLSTNNIRLYMRPEIADELELNNFLTIKWQEFEYNALIIRDDGIPEKKRIDGRIQSDIKIYSPDWIK